MEIKIISRPANVLVLNCYCRSVYVSVSFFFERTIYYGYVNCLLGRIKYISCKKTTDGNSLLSLKVSIHHTLEEVVFGSTNKYEQFKTIPALKICSVL